MFLSQNETGEKELGHTDDVRPEAIEDVHLLHLHSCSTFHYLKGFFFTLFPFKEVRKLCKTIELEWFYHSM